MKNTAPCYSLLQKCETINESRLTFDDVDEILKCGNPNKSYWAIPSFGTTR